MRRNQFLVTLVACSVLGVTVGAGIARAKRPKESVVAHDQLVSSRAPSLTIPPKSGEIVIDGEFEDAAWSADVARTGAFQSNGVVSRPYTDMRATYGDGKLFLLLYAADEDIQVSPNATPDSPLYRADAFQLVFHTPDGDRLIDVSAAGVITDAHRVGKGVPDYSWSSGAEVAIDKDGTPNDPSDQDEEWVVEMAIPLASIGLHGVPGERVDAEVRRCDDVRGAGHVCGAWGVGGAGGILVLGATGGG